MPPSIPRNKIERALKAKGFREITSNRSAPDHRYYYLFDGDRKTRIRTKISRGTKYKNYNIQLLTRMRKLLEFVSLDDFLSFIDCTMSEPQYKQYMKDRGVEI